MKKLIRVLLFAVVLATATASPNISKAQGVSVNFSVFYSSLQPYGHWMNNSSYGKVWVPRTRDFVPYSTGGHWAYTDYGWTWVSEYDWGWAPFHYGRWAYNSAYGWYWIPGYDWAPAWVAWRNNNDYYGWAPLGPGLSISVDIGTYNAIPTGWWVFAPARYIASPQVNRYYVPRTQNVTIIKNTTVVNNVTVKNNVHYVSGPRREDVERVSHQNVQTYTVANSSSPGRTVINNKTVNVYRPEINSNNKTVVNDNTVNKNSNNTTVNSNNKTADHNQNKANEQHQQDINKQQAQQNEQQQREQAQAQQKQQQQKEQELKQKEQAQAEQQKAQHQQAQQQNAQQQKEQELKQKEQAQAEQQKAQQQQAQQQKEQQAKQQAEQQRQKEQAQQKNKDQQQPKPPADKKPGSGKRE